VNVLEVLDRAADRASWKAHTDELVEARAAVAELIEAAKLARPAGEVGWPSARILEPAHAARLIAAMARCEGAQS
jgi:hypothetical protein